MEIKGKEIFIKIISILIVLICLQISFYLAPIAIPLAIIFCIVLIIFFIKFIFEIFIETRGTTIGEIKKDIVDHDIFKVADRIMYYKNRNLNDEKIIDLINRENKEKNKIFFTPLSPFFLLENKNMTFRIPKDMKIIEENNEIVIYYKKLVYSVNRGMYITSGK